MTGRRLREERPRSLFGVPAQETRFLPKNLVSELDVWADRFTATLCLVDVYLA